MRCFAVLLLFSLSAEGSSFAGECNDTKTNLTLITDTYAEAIRSVPVPTLDIGDMANRFKKDFVKASTDYGLRLTAIAYNRGQELGAEYIDAVQKDVQELRECIESLDKSKIGNTCVEADLKNLTGQLNKFLELIPGNAMIKRKPLPELPPEPAPIPSVTMERSASDIFLNLAEIFDTELSSFFNYSAIIVRAGWTGSRTVLNLQQTQIRNEILNDLMLKAYREAVDEVLRLKRIQHRVDPETWKCFKYASDRIILISNDYNASKSKKNCD